ncbi:MAG: hypothetical protein NTZ16_14125, partial [Verrucomicrobia bacterium]|nr:hypothetical protein [Verrucomicrobiota bacterium]
WGDTPLSSGASQFIRLILGTADALPTNGVLTIGSGSNGRPTWDLAGNNQTLAGLTTGTGGPITVTSSSGTPTLTISNINSAADYAFFGQNRNIGGSLMLVKTGAGRQQIGLTGAQGGTSYSGGTKILGGTLEAGVNGIGSGNVGHHRQSFGRQHGDH